MFCDLNRKRNSGVRTCVRDSDLGLSLGNSSETVDLRRAAGILLRWRYGTLTLESDCVGRYLRGVVLPSTDCLEGYDYRLAYLSGNVLPIIRAN
jgi:hypothetical protein